jgi:hydroxyquinol 1,2-dioxygenase
MIVAAPGYETLTTHIFDAESPYLDDDAVFAVKPSLLRQFVRDGDCWSVENDIVLVRAP